MGALCREAFVSGGPASNARVLLCAKVRCTMTDSHTWWQGAKLRIADDTSWANHTRRQSVAVNRTFAALWRDPLIFDNPGIEMGEGPQAPSEAAPVALLGHPNRNFEV